MVRRSMVVALACVMGVVSTGFSQMERTFRLSDRVAVSHDGNNWDKDDTYAYAMDYAIMWAFGVPQQLVHAQICNLLAGSNNAAFRSQMLESGKGRFLFPGFDTSIQFDCVDRYPQAIADFKKHAEISTENSILYFTLAGPMETGWQSLNATTASKRKFVHCVSHSDWNEKHTNSHLTHTWNNMKSSFEGGGTKFTRISDQNANLGGGGSDKWNLLNSMAGSSIPQSTWTWLKNRDFKANGDCSDNGMVCWVLTGLQTAKAADYITRFKTPIPIIVSVNPPNTAARAIDMSSTAKIHRNGNVLKVSVAGVKTGSIVVYDLLSKVVSKGSLVNGNAELACPSKLNGTYVVKIMSQNGVISQKVSLK